MPCLSHGVLGTASGLHKPQPPSVVIVSGVTGVISSPTTLFFFSLPMQVFAINLSICASFSLSMASSTMRSTSSSYEWVRAFLSELARQSSHVLGGILLTNHRWGSVGPYEEGFIRPTSSSRSATNSEIRAALGNSGSIGRFSISVRTLRSVSYTGYMRPRRFKKSPQLLLFLIAIWTWRCKNFFLHDFL